MQAFFACLFLSASAHRRESFPGPAMAQSSDEHQVGDDHKFHAALSSSAGRSKPCHLFLRDEENDEDMALFWFRPHVLQGACSGKSDPHMKLSKSMRCWDHGERSVADLCVQPCDRYKQEREFQQFLRQGCKKDLSTLVGLQCKDQKGTTHALEGLCGQRAFGTCCWRRSCPAEMRCPRPCR